MNTLFWTACVFVGSSFVVLLSLHRATQKRSPYERIDEIIHEMEKQFND